MMGLILQCRHTAVLTLKIQFYPCTDASARLFHMRITQHIRTSKCCFQMQLELWLKVGQFVRVPKNPWHKVFVWCWEHNCHSLWAVAFWILTGSTLIKSGASTSESRCGIVWKKKKNSLDNKSAKLTSSSLLILLPIKQRAATEF